MPNHKKKIAIIGAGPAGLTAADELSTKGYKVDIFESSTEVGGMAKSIRLWGRIVDLGPHRFFSNDTRVNKKWLSVIGNDYYMVDRLTRIYYKNKFYLYPLRPFNALFNLGFFESFACILSYLTAKIYIKESNTTFEDWVTKRFGHRLYSIFFKSYSEKLWGISCKDLDSDFAAQRIKKLSLFEAVKSAFINSGKKHKTLVDEFAYPFKGNGEIYLRMYERVKKNGGNVFLSTKINSIKIFKNSENKIILNNNKNCIYDHLISSMPLTNFVNLIDAPKNILYAANNLKFRNTVLVYLRLDSINIFPDQWLYIHSDNVKTGRITNFNNWNKNYAEKFTILCLEYWCNDNDKIWKNSDNSLINLAKKEIKAIGVSKSLNIIDGKIIRIPKCYPVYSVGYQENLLAIKDYIKNFKNIDVIGRYGSFKYNNQDHSILMGLLAADNIINGYKNNLWEINTDYEYHEKSTITSTGLVIE